MTTSTNTGEIRKEEVEELGGRLGLQTISYNRVVIELHNLRKLSCSNLKKLKLTKDDFNNFGVMSTLNL